MVPYPKNLMFRKALLSLTLLVFGSGLANSQGQANSVIRGQILVPSVRASERMQVILERSDGPVVGRT